jgi:uncharacterized protein (TIGR03663 family)
MHGDEANQAVKAAVLLETGFYAYDPHEHHGPTLYYFTLPVAWLAGERTLADLTESTLRLVPVLFGVGLILLLAPLASGLSRTGVLAAGVFTAISPAMVFYSRYYIQEMLLVFFTFGVIVGAWQFLTRRSIAWAAVAGVCLGLMAATKETGILAVASMVVGAVLTPLWGRVVDAAGPGVRAGPPLAGSRRAKVILLLVSALRVLRAFFRCYATGIVVAAVAALATAIVFFSSFFTHWSGVLDAVRAYTTYFQRAGGDGLHAHPFSYYLALLADSRWGTGATSGPWWSEGLILTLAVVGMIEALRPRKVALRVIPSEHGELQDTVIPALLRFLAFYTLALTLVYAIIYYKTPWCALGFLHGMILLAGVGVAAILRWTPTWPLKTLAGLVLVALAAQLGWQAWQAGTRFSADPRNPYVYAHTSTDILKLVREVDDVAAASPDGRRLLIKVITPENYWPLPWYLRNFQPGRVGYYQEVPDDPDAAVIITSPECEVALEARLRGRYNSQSMFGLRPDVLLRVYVQEDLWDAAMARRSGAVAPASP